MHIITCDHSFIEFISNLVANIFVTTYNNT